MQKKDIFQMCCKSWIIKQEFTQMNYMTVYAQLDSFEFENHVASKFWWMLIEQLEKVSPVLLGWLKHR